MCTDLTAETGFFKISLKHHILYQIPNDGKYDTGNYFLPYSLGKMKKYLNQTVGPFINTVVQKGTWQSQPSLTEIAYFLYKAYF